MEANAADNMASERIKACWEKMGVWSKICLYSAVGVYMCSFFVPVIPLGVNALYSTIVEM